MQWFTVVLFCIVLTKAIAEPEPKKYKNVSDGKDKKTESLTNDEKKFLREVEEKFGVKTEVPIVKKEDSKTEDEKNVTTPTQQKQSFPAVIAIEIVNDTDSQTKGKRTIDANLGYGYRTNDGYSYTYFGKSNQEKGKFMIYPYSQEDIPATQNVHDTKYSSYSGGKYFSPHATNVEIQPSQAFELVPLKNEHPSYEYNKPAIEFKTNYEKAIDESSEGYTGRNAAQTLYTTYNGQEFSGLSGQFPTVMPNYFVDPSQLLNNPHYQNAGLTQDHLRTQSSYLNQNKRIVPVLVLRVPSSYLKNPTAELYPDLPQNYPLSQHLNSVNLQALVNQYFQKNGYRSPQVMPYQSPSVPSIQTEPQHYSNPYVKPSYTQADYSGIQYSAVKPVMARYPLTYTQQKYLVSQPQSLYQGPNSQQYEYEYRYMPQTEVKMRTYYIQPQYQHSSQIGAMYNGYQTDPSVRQQQSHLDDTMPNVEYRSPQYSSYQQSKEAPVEYETQSAQHGIVQPDVSHYAPANPETNKYDLDQGNIDYTKQEPAYDSASLPAYSSSPDYYSSNTGQQSSVSVQPSKLIHTEQYQESTGSNVPQEYVYQTQSNEDSSKTYVLPENYPSKDHTIATVLPYTYEPTNKPSQSSVQTISYVTPMPSAKYQTQYKIMVPQTVLRNPNSEKVSYVNSQSLHYTQAGQYADSNPESDYTVGSQYVQSIASKPSYSRNYHAHPKRMVKSDSRSVASTMKTAARKSNDRSEKKKAS